MHEQGGEKMNYSLKMARLDYFTCKPNIISYFTLIPVTIIFSFMSTSSIFIFNFTAAWFIALMSTNIFVVQEKNELERLYASLSLTTQNIVAGRYIYTYEYSYAAEPPVQFRLSHLSRRSEPL